MPPGRKVRKGNGGRAGNFDHCCEVAGKPRPNGPSREAQAQVRARGPGVPNEAKSSSRSAHPAGKCCRRLACRNSRTGPLGLNANSTFSIEYRTDLTSEVGGTVRLLE